MGAPGTHPRGAPGSGCCSSQRAPSSPPWRFALVDGLVPALARTASGGGAGLSPVECAAFAARDWLRGRQLRTPAVGRADGVRADGALLVDSGGITVAVHEGHVELA